MLARVVIESRSDYATVMQQKLIDLGIRKDQSSQWQQMAAIPKPEREAYIAEPQIPTAGGLLSKLIRQYDSVGVLLVALMLFRQYFFKPYCLLFRNPLVHRFWMMADDEFLAASVTPEYSHFLKAYGLFAATFFYSYSLHTPILDHVDC